MVKKPTYRPRTVAMLRRVDRLWSRYRGRRLVLLEARTPLNLAVLRPVFEALRRDPRIRLRFTGPARADLRDAFAELGVGSLAVTSARAKWMRIDLYINADPWGAAALRRVTRRLNFFHGVAGKYDLDCPASLPIGLERYDRVAFPNAGRLAKYLDAGIVSPDQAALIGYPKIDALVRRAAPSRECARQLGLDPARATAIYAPTFSPASSLHEAGEQIVETLLDCGCNVIAKLHDRSLDTDPKYNEGVNWRARLQQFAASGRFLLASGGDSTPYVLASDLMVTDHSSIGFEFCVLDRPLIVYDAPRLASEARINPEKVALLRSAAAVVRTPAELRAAFFAALASPMAQSAERRSAADDVFYQPGTATQRAVQLVYELLDLSALPDPVGVGVSHVWSRAD